MLNQVLNPICSRLSVLWNSGRLVLVTSAVVTVSLLGLRQVGALEALELNVYDQMIRLRTDQGSDDRLLVVAVTETDIRSRNEYPLSDGTVAELLKTLEQHEPRAIGLDIIRDVPQGEGRDELTRVLTESDRIFGVCKMSDSTGPGFPPPPGLAEDRISSVSLLRDPNGIVRRALLLINPLPPEGSTTDPFPAGVCDDPEITLPSLAMDLAVRYLQAEGIDPDFTPQDELQLGAAVFTPLTPHSGPYQYADVGGYQILLDYRSPRNPAVQVTLTEVLSGQIDPNLVQDRIVLIGYTASSVHDEFPTPFSAGQQGNEPMSGVVIHAQIVSQILTAATEGRSLFWFLPEWGEWLWILGWSLAGGTLAWRFRHPLPLGASMMAVMGVGFGICFGALTQSGWIPIIPPALALVTTAGGVILIDRFNKAGYTRAIYEGIKGFLRIDIKIDEGQKEREVAEITESVYFQELEKRADLLRNQKNEPAQPDSQADHSRSPATSPTPTQPKQYPILPDQTRLLLETGSLLDLPDSADTNGEPDYFQQIQQKSAKLKRRSDAPPPPPPRPVPPPPPPNKRLNNAIPEGALPEVNVLLPAHAIPKEPTVVQPLPDLFPGLPSERSADATSYPFLEESELIELPPDLSALEMDLNQLFPDEPDLEQTPFDLPLTSIFVEEDEPDFENPASDSMPPAVTVEPTILNELEGSQVSFPLPPPSPSQNSLTNDEVAKLQREFDTYLRQTQQQRS